MSAPPLSVYDTQPLHQALASLATVAVSNIPGVDLASISVRRQDQSLDTVAATDQLARDLDSLQYQLREGPCVAAVTDERCVVVNDLAADDSPYPQFGKRAVQHGVRAQTAIQLAHDGEQAGLNLYARKPQAFDHTTVQMAELFSSQAAALLGYARQVGWLGEAVHTRQDIGTAVGIVMETYGLNPERALRVLIHLSNERNIKLRAIAQGILDGTFKLAASDSDAGPHTSAR